MAVLPKLLVCDKHFLNVNCVCVFRLNSSDAEGEPIYIQMVSALVLQLIQCVVHLPSEKDSEDDHKKVLVTHPTLLELVSHLDLQVILTIRFTPFFRLMTMCSSQTRMKQPDGRLRTSSPSSSRSQNILPIFQFFLYEILCLANVFIPLHFFTFMLLPYVNCFKLVFFYISLHSIHYIDKAKTELSQLCKLITN